jgi:hypothetical protein
VPRKRAEERRGRSLSATITVTAPATKLMLFGTMSTGFLAMMP